MQSVLCVQNPDHGLSGGVQNDEHESSVSPANSSVIPLRRANCYQQSMKGNNRGWRKTLHQRFTVTISASEGHETFELTVEKEAGLLKVIADADRGDTISVSQALLPPSAHRNQGSGRFHYQRGKKHC
jgi:hypothetical protein